MLETIILNVCPSQRKGYHITLLLIQGRIILPREEREEVF